MASFGANHGPLSSLPAPSSQPDYKRLHGPGGPQPIYPGIASEPQFQGNWGEFFGEPNAGLPAPPPYSLADKSSQDMPAAYKGVNHHLSEQIGHMELLAGDFYTTRLAPIEWTNDINFTWSEISFNAHTAGVVPHKAGPRLVAYRSKQLRVTLSRRGIAMQFEHSFMLTEEGRNRFANSLKAMALAVNNTLNLEVMRAIRSVDSSSNMAFGHSEIDGLSNKSIHDLMRDGVAQWYGMLTPGYAPQAISGARHRIKKHRGELPDTLLVGDGFQQFLTHVDTERTSYEGIGGGTNSTVESDPDTHVATYMGLPVYAVLSFDVEEVDIDLMRNTAEIGEFYRANYVITDKYTSQDATYQIYDEDNDRWYKITPQFSVANCDLWDDEGHVIDIVTDSRWVHEWVQGRFNQGDLRNMSPYYTSDLAKDGPHTAANDPHAEIEATRNDIDSDLRHIHPVKYVGQIEPEHLRTSDLAQIAEVVCARSSTNESAMVEMFAQLRDIVEDWGNRAFDTRASGWFRAVAAINPTDGATTRPTMGVDNMAFEGGMFHTLPNNPNFAYAVPYGCVSYNAMVHIADQSARWRNAWSDSVQRQFQVIRELLPRFRQFTDTLSGVLGPDNPVFDKLYDRLGNAKPNHYSTFWNAVIASDMFTVFVKRATDIEIESARARTNQVLDEFDSVVENNDDAAQFLDPENDTRAVAGMRMGAATDRKAQLLSVHGNQGFGELNYTSSLSGDIVKFAVRATLDAIKKSDSTVDFTTDENKTRLDYIFTSKGWSSAVSNERIEGIVANAIAAGDYSGAAGEAAAFATVILRSKRGFSNFRHLVPEVETNVRQDVRAIIDLDQNKAGGAALVSDANDDLWRRTGFLIGTSTAEDILNVDGDTRLVTFADPRVAELPVRNDATLFDVILPDSKRYAKSGDPRHMAHNIVGGYARGLLNAEIDHPEVADYITANAPALRLLATTSSFTVRVHQILSRYNRFISACLVAYLTTPFTRDGLTHLADSNIPLPCRFLVFRPHASYDTVAIVAMKAGATTMKTHKRPGLFEIADTATTQTSYANYIAYMNVTMLKPENIVNINHMLPAGVNGGMGVRLFRHEKYSYGEKTYGEGESMFIVMVGHASVDTVTSPIALSGYFHMYSRHIEDRTIVENNVKHYDTAPLYAGLWGWGAAGMEQYDNDPFRGNEATNIPPNEIMYAGHQNNWNPSAQSYTNVEEGNGHMAGLTYIGACHMRDGKLLRGKVPVK